MLQAASLAFGVISLGNVDRNDALGVASQHGFDDSVGIRRWIGLELEGQAMLGIVGLVPQRQSQAKERVRET